MRVKSDINEIIKSLFYLITIQNCSLHNFAPLSKWNIKVHILNIFYAFKVLLLIKHNYMSKTKRLALALSSSFSYSSQKSCFCDIKFTKFKGDFLLWWLDKGHFVFFFNLTYSLETKVKILIHHSTEHAPFNLSSAFCHTFTYSTRSAVPTKEIFWVDISSEHSKAKSVADYVCSEHYINNWH